MSTITVKVFAGLKKYFDREFVVEIYQQVSIEEVLNKLILMRPESQQLLAACRFAVAEEFVPKNYLLKNGEELYLIPPSSGG